MCVVINISTYIFFWQICIVPHHWLYYAAYLTENLSVILTRITLLEFSLLDGIKILLLLINIACLRTFIKKVATYNHKLFISHLNIGRLNNSDEFELKFPELKRFRAELSRGISILELKSSWFFFALVRIFQFCTCIIVISNSNDHLSELMYHERYFWSYILWFTCIIYSFSEKYRFSKKT